MKTNSYAKHIPNLDRMSKEDLAAVAVSLATLLEDGDFIAAGKRVIEERKILRANGII